MGGLGYGRCDLPPNKALNLQGGEILGTQAVATKCDVPGYQTTSAQSGVSKYLCGGSSGDKSAEAWIYERCERHAAGHYPHPREQ